MSLRRWRKPIVFFCLLFSGVSFSASTFGLRLLAPDRLPDFIFFQTSSVFAAFLFQAGLRAGLRNEVSLGRVRAAGAAEAAFIRLITVVAIAFSALSLLQDAYPIFPVFAALHAVLTTSMGVRIVRRRLAEASLYALGVAGTILAAGALFLLTPLSLAEARLPVEFVSTLILLAHLVFVGQPRYQKTALKIVFSRAFGIQVSSFLVYLANFLLGQYVVVLGRTELAVAVAYADVQIVCGAQMLVLGRLLLFYERRFVRSGRVGQLAAFAAGWLVLLSLAMAVAVSIWKGMPQAWIYTVLTFAFFGRFPLAVVAQFVRPRLRTAVYLGAGATTAILAGALAVVRELELALPAIVAGSPGTAVLILLLFAALRPGRFFLSRQDK